MIRIRDAEFSDIKTLSLLAQKTYMEAFGHSFQPEDLKVHLSTHLSEESFRKTLQVDKVLVAVYGKKIIGFVQFGSENDGEDELKKDWELKRLYVQQENQNNGIGSRLMDLALNQMKEYQVKRVFLDVWEQNPRAILFYQRFGFEVVGKRKFEVASGAETSADLIMVLSI